MKAGKEPIGGRGSFVSSDIPAKISSEISLPGPSPTASDGIFINSTFFNIFASFAFSSSSPTFESDGGPDKKYLLLVLAIASSDKLSNVAFFLSITGDP